MHQPFLTGKTFCIGVEQGTEPKVLLLSYRYDAVVLQALSPQLNPLHGSQVRACPVKPLVVPMAPLAIMNEHFLCFVVNLLYVGSIPARAKKGRHQIRQVLGSCQRLNGITRVKITSELKYESHRILLNFSNGLIVFDLNNRNVNSRLFTDILHLEPVTIKHGVQWLVST